MTTGHEPAKTSIWAQEDIWAVVLGMAFLLLGLLMFAKTGTVGDDEIAALQLKIPLALREAPFSTTAHHRINEETSDALKNNHPRASAVKALFGEPHGWKVDPSQALFLSQAQVDDASQAYRERDLPHEAPLAVAANAALKAETQARAKDFEDESLNKAAQAAIASWRTEMKAEQKNASSAKQKPYNQLPWLLALGVFFIVALGGPATLMDRVTGVSRETWRTWGGFAAGFALIFVLAVLSYLLAAQSTLKHLGFGFAAWSIFLGLLIGNTVGTPAIVLKAARSEFFIKTGLVLLGAEILFGKVLAIGLPGIFVAWVVTPVVLVSTYWFGQRILKIGSKTLNITIAADMSVCGISAAIATAAACRAKKEELTLAVGLSLVFTAIMMIAMPAFIGAVGMDPILGGAWIGGTLDATGAVAAAGAFLGESALHVAATIKMIQNILIGVVAFAVAFYFTTRVEAKAGAKVDAGEIWRRFPKFVLGFVAASVIFSLMHGLSGRAFSTQVLENGVIGSYTTLVRGWLFCLAFVSIGLSTDFRKLRHHLAGGKALILYVCGQTLNLVLTLAMAYLMFKVVFVDLLKGL